MAQDSANKSSKSSQLRLLVLAPISNNATSPSPFPFFLRKLTNAAPPADIDTFAGYTSHPPVHFETKYYKADVAIWCDELPSPITQTKSKPAREALDDTPIASKDGVNDLNDVDSTTPTQATFSESQSTLSDWQDQMLSDSAQEVRDVIGSIVLLLPFTQPALASSLNSAKESSLVAYWASYMQAVSALSERIEDESGRSVPSIVLLQSITTSSTTISDKEASAMQALREQTEREIMDEHGILGLDFVLWNQMTDDLDVTGSEDTVTSATSTTQPLRNEFGEKTGFPRVIEVLEGTDWTADPSGADSDVDDLNETTESGLDFLDEAPDSETTIDKHSYSAINKTARPQYRTTLSMASGADTDASETESLLAREQQEFQREMLGLKMAMLDNGGAGSAPSSLAGEFDANDFGARTPAPASRLGLGSFSPGERSTEAVRGARGNGAVKDGDEVAVEQLTGLMERVVAMREAASELPEAEREKFARREVKKIMKELG